MDIPLESRQEYKNLLEYEENRDSSKKEKDLLIDDKFFRLSNHNILIDVKLRKNINLRKQSVCLVKTKIYINGPIHNFIMLVKKHKYYPISAAVLETCGFISNVEKCPLVLKLRNPYNYDLKLLENDIVACLVLTPFLKIEQM